MIGRALQRVSALRPKAWWLLPVTLGVGCASVEHAEPSGVAFAADYRLRFESADTKPITVHAEVVIHGDLIRVELKGAVGSAQLIAAIEPQRVRLIIVRERCVVEGLDTTEFWRRWTGVPVSGSLIRRLTIDSAPAAIDDWAVREWSGRAGQWPERVGLEGRAGERLTLELIGRRGLLAAPTWPPIPAGFQIDGEGGANCGPRSTAGSEERR